MAGNIRIGQQLSSGYNPDGTPGTVSTGLPGPAGAPATDSQVLAAVTAYLQAHPVSATQANTAPLTRYGIGATGTTGAWVGLGDNGSTVSGYLVAGGSAADVDLHLLAKGNGVITADGPTKVVGTLTTAGDVTVQGALSVAAGASVGGAFTAASAALSGALSAGVSTLGATTVTGALTAGASTLSSATVSGTLNAGASTLASATVSGTLTAGASTLSSVTVSGASSLATVTVSGTAALSTPVALTDTAVSTAATEIKAATIRKTAANRRGFVLSELPSDLVIGSQIDVLGVLATLWAQVKTLTP